MRNIRNVFTLLLASAVCFTLFVYWASSGTIDAYTWEHEYQEASGPPPDTLSIMTYNVGYLSGMANNLPVSLNEDHYEANLERVRTVLARIRPDAIAFQEIDISASRSFDVNQVDVLARELGCAQAAVAVNWDERYVPFPSAWPWHHFGRVVSSQSVISRFPIGDHRRFVLPSTAGAALYGTESWLGRLAKRFYIERLAQVVVLEGAPSLAVVNVHLEAWDAPTRERQVQRLIELVDSLHTRYDVFVAGDFNSILPVVREAGRAPPRVLERFDADRSIDLFIAATGFRAAMADLTAATGDPSTFTFSSVDPEVKIDHIFYDPERYDVVSAHVVDIEGPPSDHRPVVARFVRRR